MAKYQLQQKLANGTMEDIPITSVNDVADINVIADDYTEVDLINKNGNTLAAIPFRKINGESIIGKDPLTTSGGGASHPVYTEANTDKWAMLGNGTTDNCKFKFTGESGSRYYFDLGNCGQFQGAMLELEIVNTDVEVIFYSTITDRTWYDHQITNSPNAVCLTNSKLMLVTFDEIARSRLDLTLAGQDESISNTLAYGDAEQSINVNIGFGTPPEADYANGLIISMRKDDVGILHVNIGGQFEV